MIVENVALGVDTRLRKQVRDLLAEGHRVSVITMRDGDNEVVPRDPAAAGAGVPPPAQPGGAMGYLREYLVSFGWAAALAFRLRLRGRIDVLQVCQPPDVYFPLCRLLRWSGTRVVIDQRDLMPELLGRPVRASPARDDAALGWLERRSQKVAHHTLCVNEYLQERLVAAGAPRAQVSGRPQRPGAGPRGPGGAGPAS